MNAWWQRCGRTALAFGLAMALSQCGSDDDGGTAGPSTGGAGGATGGSGGTGGTDDGGSTGGTGGSMGGTGGSTGGTGGSMGGTGGSGGGAGSIDSGLDGTKVANTLTSSEATQLCEAFAEYFDAEVPASAIIDALCAIEAAGIMFSGTRPAQEECMDHVTMCAAMAPMPAPVDCALDVMELASCTATVDELETCMEAITTQSKMLYGALNCTIVDYTPQQIMELQEMFTGMLPTECNAVDSKCPGLLTP